MPALTHSYLPTPRFQIDADYLILHNTCKIYSSVREKGRKKGGVSLTPLHHRPIQAQQTGLPPIPASCDGGSSPCCRSCCSYCHPDLQHTRNQRRQRREKCMKYSRTSDTYKWVPNTHFPILLEPQKKGQSLYKAWYQCVRYSEAQLHKEG